MAALQRRRIESALSEANEIERQMDAADEALTKSRDLHDDLRATLHSVRFGMLRREIEQAVIEETQTDAESD